MRQADLRIIVDGRNMVEKLRGELERIMNDEQTNYDEKSEGWQESDKGEEVQANIESMDDIITCLSDAENAFANLSY